MDGLIDAFADISWLDVNICLRTGCDAQLKHGARHSGKLFRAPMHALDHFTLFFRQGTHILAQQQTAITGNGRQWCSKVVNGSGQESRTVVIVLLQFQICLHEALQNIVAVGTQCFNRVILCAGHLLADIRQKRF
jgi:hypothetical protein